MAGFGHCPDGARLNAFYHAAEVLIQRKQRVRLNFPQGTAQLLLDAVNLVEEGSAIHLHLPAAELPISREQKMKTEETELLRREGSSGDQQKVRYVLLVFHPPAVAGIFTPRVLLQPNAADVFLPCGTKPKTVIASAKDGSQNTIAWQARLALAFVMTHSITLAMRTALSGESDNFGPVPVKPVDRFSHYCSSQPPGVVRLAYG